MKANDALLCTGNILRTTHQYVRLYPNGSRIAAFFLFLFFVCPFGFRFLTYSAATVYGSAVIVKIIANSGPYDLHESALHPLNNHESPLPKSDSDDGIPVGQKHKPKISTQMSKRRNFKVRIEDLETLDNAEGKQVSSLGTDDNQIDGGDGMPTEGGLVAHRGASSCEGESGAGKCARTLNKGKSISDFVNEMRQSKEGCQSETEANDSSEDAEDEEEEDAPGGRSQAVEWTEEDQQSLMDLGLSELERNKRLENLIAKRMMKKSASMKNQDNLLDLDVSQPGAVPPVNISENPFVPPRLSDDTLKSQLPGSATSVSLPERSPFDLPYDSNEEKPNLTVDSISPEILAPHPKDIVSQHESFFQGPPVVTTGTNEDSGAGSSSQLSVSEKRNFGERRLTRFGHDSDKDQHDEQMLSKGEDPKFGLDGSKNDETTDSVHDDLKVQSNEKHCKDASVGDKAEKESTSSTSEGQKDVESLESNEKTEMQTGLGPEEREVDELPKRNENNSNSMNNPFGSLASPEELEKEGSLQQQQGQLAKSAKSSCDTDLENTSSLENQTVPPAHDQAHLKQDEEVNKEGR